MSRVKNRYQNWCNRLNTDKIQLTFKTSKLSMAIADRASTFDNFK